MEPCSLSQSGFHYFISHWDLDGIVSAALLVRTARMLELSYDYRLATPSSLPRFLEKAVSADTVIVADLAPQQAHVEKLASLVKEFNRIVWIDHHVWPDNAEEVFNSFGNVNLLIDVGRVAAELVYSYLVDSCGVDLEGYKELVELARLDDTNDVVGGNARLLRVVLRLAPWELRYRLVDSLATNPTLPSWLREVGGRLLQKYDNLLRESLRRIRLFEAECGARIVVVESPPQLHPGDIIESLPKVYRDADVYLVVYPDALSIRTRIVNASIIARRFGGGGHEVAAGAPRPQAMGVHDIARIVGEEFCRLLRAKAGTPQQR